MEYAYLYALLNGILYYRPSFEILTGNLSRVYIMSAMAWKNLIRADSEASPMVGLSK
jgi:hypothetical protein